MLFLSLPPEDPLAAQKQRLLGLTSPFELCPYTLLHADDARPVEEKFSFRCVAYAEAEEFAAAPDARLRARSLLSARDE